MTQEEAEYMAYDTAVDFGVTVEEVAAGVARGTYSVPLLEALALARVSAEHRAALMEIAGVQFANLASEYLDVAVGG